MPHVPLDVICLVSGGLGSSFGHFSSLVSDYLCRYRDGTGLCGR